MHYDDEELFQTAVESGGRHEVKISSHSFVLPSVVKRSEEHTSELQSQR